jgi:plastocyanin
MQRAMLNRATIEVADTAEVSGRLTADKVNLDRFQNLIRKVRAFVRATLIPSSLRWILLFAVLIVPQVLRGAASASATPQTWHATVGAESSDKGRQALAFLPNEIWIHAGDSITWTFDTDEIHTVTFIPDSEPRPFSMYRFSDMILDVRRHDAPLPRGKAAAREHLLAASIAAAAQELVRNHHRKCFTVALISAAFIDGRSKFHSGVR